MVMSKQSALEVLARVEEIIDSARSAEQACGKGEYWQRDKELISAVRACILSDDSKRVRWALDQMRNLSQGFCSYCDDLKRLDGLLDELYSELVQLLFV